MKDIKITKKIIPNKVVEPEKKIEEVSFEIPQKKSKVSVLSTTLFGLMVMSVFAYVFMISSSVFYAVKMNQYTFKAENLSAVVVSKSNIGEEYTSKSHGDRISYINKDSDTSISLK